MLKYGVFCMIWGLILGKLHSTIYILDAHHPLGSCHLNMVPPGSHLRVPRFELCEPVGHGDDPKLHRIHVTHRTKRMIVRSCRSPFGVTKMLQMANLINKPPMVPMVIQPISGKTRDCLSLYTPPLYGYKVCRRDHRSPNALL